MSKIVQALCKLLVVDDEPEICEIVRDIAEDVGYQVETCTEIHQFHDLYDGFRPDVILLDLVMPCGNGVELIEHLATLESRSQIILFSGKEINIEGRLTNRSISRFAINKNHAQTHLP